MTQGRDHVHDVELGLSTDGTFRWIRIKVTANVGAYPGIGAFLPFFTMLMASGPYRIGAVHYEAVAAVTNTTPVAAFRGAGRPEATVCLERIIDLAAAELGMDPVELRRRNLLPPGDFPLTTPTGANMDCGDYARALDLALERAGYADLRAKQARRRAAGDRRLLGIGVSTYVEVTAVGLFQEYGSVTVELDGRVTARVGTASHGQGHATAFSQILGEVLGVPSEQVGVIHSDTAEVPRGTGTVASRSLQIGGSAVWTAANEVLDTGAAPGGQPAGSRYRRHRRGSGRAGPRGRAGADGVVGRAGRGRGRRRPARRRRAGRPGRGDRLRPGRGQLPVRRPRIGGGDRLRHRRGEGPAPHRGRRLRPHPQPGARGGPSARRGRHWNLAGTLRGRRPTTPTGTPAIRTSPTNAIPAASELPRIETAHTETPTPLNPLGAKGVGESGTIGSTPAVQSAVLDALAPLGVSHLDMPYTPQRVWRAIAAADAAARS